MDDLLALAVDLALGVLADLDLLGGLVLEVCLPLDLVSEGEVDDVEAEELPLERGDGRLVFLLLMTCLGVVLRSMSMFVDNPPSEDDEDDEEAEEDFIDSSSSLPFFVSPTLPIV